jgi:uncharacterized protein (DUF885 family)
VSNITDDQHGTKITHYNSDWLLKGFPGKNDFVCHEKMDLLGRQAKKLVGDLSEGLNMSMLRLKCVAIFCVFTSICFGQAVEEPIEKSFRVYLDKCFELRPLEATLLGDHRFDHQLDDVSREARGRWLDHYRQQLASLEQDPRTQSLDRASKIDFEIWRDELIRNVWLAENTSPFEEDPRVYGNYINDSVYLLLAQSTLPIEQNVKNAIARMHHIPRIVETARATIKNPPRSILDTAIAQNKGAIDFYENGIYQLIGNEPLREMVRQSTPPVLEAIKGYQKFLEADVLPRANGEWRLGKEKFDRKLQLVLDVGLNADEVLRDALSEFDRVQDEMYVVARQLWSRYFPGQVLPADNHDGRRETVAAVVSAVSQEHSQPSALIADARSSVKDIQDFITKRDILTLPQKDRCQVIEMPEFRRGNSLAYLDSALPLDPEGFSYYAISPPPKNWNQKRVNSFLEEYNNHMLQILTIHEAYPGHYVQLQYSNRVPSLVRRVLQSGAYVEGWAVYTEQMMLDQGYGDGSLPLRLNQLKFYLRAVGNTILDHRMHCTNMSDQEALNFLTREAYQSDGEALLKIVRAKQSSVQLSTYFAGRMAFYRLREQIQREQGSSFDLGRYHEAVLENGSVPVKFLPELVRARLAEPRTPAQ